MVLTDDVDDANGSASPLPYNTMRLYAAPPGTGSELLDHRDWLETLVFHEYPQDLSAYRLKVTMEPVTEEGSTP